MSSTIVLSNILLLMEEPSYKIKIVLYILKMDLSNKIKKCTVIGYETFFLVSYQAYVS